MLVAHITNPTPIIFLLQVRRCNVQERTMGFGIASALAPGMLQRYSCTVSDKDPKVVEAVLVLDRIVFQGNEALAQHFAADLLRRNFALVVCTDPGVYTAAEAPSSVLGFIVYVASALTVHITKLAVHPAYRSEPHEVQCDVDCCCLKITTSGNL